MTVFSLSDSLSTLFLRIAFPLSCLFSSGSYNWGHFCTNTDMISEAIQGFDCDKAFLDKSTQEKASILTKTILNILSNFIPNEIVTIDDKYPPWINNKIKSLIRNKNEYFKNCIKSNNSESIRHFEQMEDTLLTSIEISKQKYYFKLSRTCS